ncbi:MAG: TatD family hydrolase [Saprospiraceae bacterium]
MPESAPVYSWHYLNVHTHAPTGNADALEIESLYFGQSLSGKTRFFSAGLHPWYIAGMDMAVAEAWMNALVRRPNMIAVGETGLDKRAGAAWSDQLAAFDCCIRLAKSLNKPLVIHCVRAYEEVLLQLQKHRFLPDGKVIFHGFNKHAQIAARLLQAGCYLSFGADLFRLGNHAADALRQTPDDRFFLETDDKQIGIEEIYARAAAIRGVSDAVLSDILRQNARAVFESAVP